MRKIPVSDQPPDPPEQPREASGPLEPDQERLFGLDSDTWTDRLRTALGPRPARIGPYEVLDELGRGGQGAVYKAIQPGTGRFVALKCFFGLDESGDREVLEQLTREVQAQSRLNHPNVVAVHSIERHERCSMLVIEHIDGTPIDQWSDALWKEGGSPLRTVLHAFASMCDGVAHAHQRGVIHRDIKPSNVLVDNGGVPKILDFGIAKLQDDRAGHAEGDEAAAVAANSFSGTPAYAAPEQFVPGGTIDTRTDVYALGMLLHRMLAGVHAHAPRPGAMPERGTIVPASTLRAGVPRDADWIIRKATHGHPDQRYSSADALAADVRRLMEGRVVLAHPPSMGYVMCRAVALRPKLSAGVVTGVLAILTLGAVSMVQAVRLTERSRDLTNALGDATEARDLAIAAQGRQRELLGLVVGAAMGAAQDTHFITTTDVSPTEALARVVNALSESDPDDVRVELLMRYGFLLFEGRRYREAHDQLRRALTITERIDEPSSERTVRITQRCASALAGLNRRDEALDLVTRAIERAGAHGDSPYSVGLWWMRLRLMDELGMPTEQILACAIDFIAQTDRYPHRPSERARAREESAGTLSPRGEIALAEAWLRESLAISEEAKLGGQDRSRFNAALALLLAQQGRWEETEPHIRSAADYRVRSETAHGGRGHRYTRLHAEVLLQLGRFGESAARWEQALIRPMAADKRDEREIAIIRFRLGAARLMVGEVEAARNELARALSKGRTLRTDDPEITETLARVEAALLGSRGVLNADVEIALGEHASVMRHEWFIPVPDVSVPPP